MQITVTVAGANRVELVENLRACADNLDGTPAAAGTGKVMKSTAKKAAAAPVAEETTDEDDGFTSDTGETNGFDDEVVDEPPKKATKAAKQKKLTLDDVNDACKAHAQAKGRPATLAILQKKFKTQSVTALKPEQYETCIAAMSVG